MKAIVCPAVLPIVEVVSETEGKTGWDFALQFVSDEGALVKLTLSLSWQDYDLYCPDGAAPPEAVARAVGAVAWALWPEGLPARLDAAALRRRDRAADERVTQQVDLSAM